MRLNLHVWRSGPQETEGTSPDRLRCCDLAMIGLILAIAAGFVCQGIVWLAM